MFLQQESGLEFYTPRKAENKPALLQMAVKAADAGVKVCTGIVSYSSTVTVEVDPCCQNTACAIVDQFNQGALSYRAGSTNTAGALKVSYVAWI